MNKQWLLLIAVVGVVAGVSQATEPVKREAAGAPPVERAQVDKSKIVPTLMVQSAKQFTYDNGKLKLSGVSPTTVVFSDRPERRAGAVPTESFIADWSQGKDSFEKVPPNADFSTFDEKGVKNAVVELRNPVMEGDALTYDVRVLKGELPAKGGESAMFIDIIGMPWTPMSFAGVARRSARRAAYWSMPHAAYVAPPVAAVPPPHVVVW
jgi:hypothetical protein